LSEFGDAFCQTSVLIESTVNYNCKVNYFWVTPQGLLGGKLQVVGDDERVKQDMKK